MFANVELTNCKWPDFGPTIPTTSCSQVTGVGPNPSAMSEEWTVVHERVVRRAEASKDAKMLGVEKKGASVEGLVVEVEGIKWLRSPMKGASGEVESFMMIDGASIGLGVLLEPVNKAPTVAEGDYFVVQGPLFKKPGKEPTTDKVVKISRQVGSVVKTTGNTWKGPSGGEWVELDSSAGEKPGWLLIEGPGFNVPGPMLEKASLEGELPVVLKLFSMITNSELCEICVDASQTIGTLKKWISLRDPHNLKAGKVLIAREKPGEDEPSTFSVSSFPVEKLHSKDGEQIKAAGLKAGDYVPYFYMGEPTDDGAFNK